jgi:hypothetical protein
MTIPSNFKKKFRLGVKALLFYYSIADTSIVLLVYQTTFRIGFLEINSNTIKISIPKLGKV